MWSFYFRTNIQIIHLETWNVILHISGIEYKRNKWVFKDVRGLSPQVIFAKPSHNKMIYFYYVYYRLFQVYHMLVWMGVTIRQAISWEFLDLRVYLPCIFKTINVVVKEKNKTIVITQMYAPKEIARIIGACILEGKQQNDQEYMVLFHQLDVYTNICREGFILTCAHATQHNILLGSIHEKS